MDRERFREELAALDPGDEAALVTLVGRRVEALSGRHQEIQDEIADDDAAREDIRERLAAVEAEILRQADESVDAEVETVADLEALPDDADVSFDDELVAELEAVRERARENQRRTSERGTDLQAELNDNTEELELYGDTLAAVESGELDAAAARERLLEHLGEE
jgi:hypothetical protein